MYTDAVTWKAEGSPPDKPIIKLASDGGVLIGTEAPLTSVTIHASDAGHLTSGGENPVSNATQNADQRIRIKIAFGALFLELDAPRD